MRRTAIRCLAGWAIGSFPMLAFADLGSTPSDAWGAGPVVVIPFANHTDDSQALIRVMRKVYEELDRREISYVPSDQIRPLLRRFRIRTAGQIGETGASIIARETEATTLLLGSVDIYVTDIVPEIGISCRLVAAGQRTVRRAASVAATGRDYSRAFDGGRVRSADEVMQRVVTRLFDRLDALSPGKPSAEAAGPVIVVPFDNSSDYARADEIVTSVLVSELVADGYQVIEPGIAREVALRDADLARGSADHALLGAFTRAFGPGFVVTGTVETFRAASGPRGSELPRIEIIARTIETDSHRLLMGFNTEKAGDDSETIFQRGRCYSVGRLAGDALASLVDRIGEEGVDHHGQ